MDHHDDDATSAADIRHRKAFGRRIKWLRTAHGWSQEQLADAIGMDRTFLGKVERGKHGMNTTSLWPLAKAFGKSVPDLFIDDKGQPIR